MNMYYTYFKTSKVICGFKIITAESKSMKIKDCSNNSISYKPYSV